MGFYVRKSINVGPFRFNLSQSGVGVSTGIKGFRVGTGPRGNYVHMGRGGLYFRTTLPGPGSRPGLPPASEPQGAETLAEDAGFQQLEAGTVSQMVDSSSAQLLDEINQKAARQSLWPFAVAATCLLHIVLVAAQGPLWPLWLTVPFSALGIAGATYRDKLKKTVVLFYAMERHVEEAYQTIHNALGAAQSCGGTWQIPSQRHTIGTYDWKVNSGADAIVTRKTVRFSTGHPPYFQTNIAVPFVPAARLKLYFFPDRILVYDGSHVGAINYADLGVSSTNIQFHESGFVPSDAKVVGRTWRYVNKSGGPDRRFSYNPELPIVLYEEVQIRSSSGMSEVFQFSRQGIGAELKKAFAAMTKALTTAPPDSDDKFIVCPCNVCNGHIEFPEKGEGQTIKCPFCGMDTVLFVPARPLS